VEDTANEDLDPMAEAMEVDLLEVVTEVVLVDMVEAMEDIELIIRCLDSSYFWENLIGGG
jgi:hypothetical protein